jgi:plastocyanin
MPCALAAAGIAAGGSTPAVHAAVPQAATTARVSMVGFTFSPATVTIHAGDTVTWTYDEKPLTLLPSPGCELPVLQLPRSPVRCPGHSTTALDTANGKPLWDSGVHRALGFPFSHTFAQAGTFKYICVIHGGTHANNPVTRMNGVVVVRAASTAQGASAQGTAPASDASQVTTAGVAAATVIGVPQTGAGVSGAMSLVLLSGGVALLAGARRRDP